MFPLGRPIPLPTPFFHFPAPAHVVPEGENVLGLSHRRVGLPGALRGRTGPTWGESTTCPQEQLEPGPRDRTGTEGKVTRHLRRPVLPGAWQPRGRATSARSWRSLLEAPALL